MKLEELIQQLIKHEGLKLKPYKCTANKLTIGVGRNIEDRGISENEAMYMLSNDIKLSNEELERTFPFYKNLNDTRQNVLINMHMNLGLPKLLTFRNFLKELNDNNFLYASDEMLDSRWSLQVGNRAIELANLMRKGA